MGRGGEGGWVGEREGEGGKKEVHISEWGEWVSCAPDSTAPARHGREKGEGKGGREGGRARGGGLGDARGDSMGLGRATTTADG